MDTKQKNSNDDFQYLMDLVGNAQKELLDSDIFQHAIITSPHNSQSLRIRIFDTKQEDIQLIVEKSIICDKNSHTEFIEDDFDDSMKAFAKTLNHKGYIQFGL